MAHKTSGAAQPDPGAAAAFTEHPDGVTVAIYVKPRASRTRVVGIHGDALAVQVAAPPVDGAANDELVGFLAKALAIPRAMVSLEAGQTGRHKRVRLMGVRLAQATAALLPGA